MSRRLDKEPRRQSRPLPPLNPTPLELSGIDSAGNVVEWANRYINNTVTPRDKLTGLMDLCDKLIPNTAIARAIGIDEGQMCEMLLVVDPHVSDETLSALD